MSDGVFALWRWQRLLADWEVFASGLLTTLTVAVLALLLALLVGVVLGLFSTSESRVLRGFARVYVEFFQNTPLVIQVFFLYNGLPYAGIVLSEFAIGVLGVGLYHGAYIAEVVRAGIQSIHRGQMEAAHSQGFTTLQAMLWIILPQTVRIILPPMANQAVNLVKNTSVLAIIAGGDLMYRSNAWATNGTLSYGPSYVVTGVLYFILCFPLATWARRYEERLRSRTVPVAATSVSRPNKEVAIEC
jgi:putative glutamine transport system permease protein